MKLNSSAVQEKLEKYMLSARHYSVPIFLLFLVSIYGFLGWRVASLNQVEPDQSAVTSKLKTAGVPRIDQDVLTKIQKLQDNSVEVRALFDKARSSPFEE